MARAKILALLALGTMAAGCAEVRPDIVAKRNASLYSVHQPVVQRTDYVIDLAATESGLPESEAQRLRVWFDTLRLGYGDRVSVDMAPGYAEEAVEEDVGEVASAYGLLLNDEAPITTGAVQPGFARVVVSRTTASVPSCPDWAYAELTGAPVTTDSNFGCAVNSNVAAMIADPIDLVQGQDGSNRADAATASKAVSQYRNAPPSGASGLKTETGGKK